MGEISKKAEVGEISKKVQESRLKWDGNILRLQRIYEEYARVRVMMMDAPGKSSWRGRLKCRWLGSTRNDLSEIGQSGKEAQDRGTWR